jgi:GNAT superfamily N-acetyltransferase
MDWSRDDYCVSDDPSRLDRAMIQRFIGEESYWAKGIPEGTMRKAIDNSLCLGLYHGESQVGFARVVTDRATFAYLCDVFVVEGHRSGGLGKWLVSCVLAHPELHGLRRFSLMTRDAQDLYRRFGFAPMQDPTHYLEIRRPDVYRAG